jgi:hypothetical protein
MHSSVLTAASNVLRIATLGFVLLCRSHDAADAANADSTPTNVGIDRASVSAFFEALAHASDDGFTSIEKNIEFGFPIDESSALWPPELSNDGVYHLRDSIDLFQKYMGQRSACYVLESSADGQSKYVCMLPYKVASDSEFEDIVAKWDAMLHFELPQGTRVLQYVLPTTLGSDKSMLCLRADYANSTLRIELWLRPRPAFFNDRSAQHSLDLVISGQLHPGSLPRIPHLIYSGQAGGELGSVLDGASFGIDGAVVLIDPALDSSFRPQVFRDFVIAHEDAHCSLGHLNELSRERPADASRRQIFDRIRKRLETAADRLAVHNLLASGRYHQSDIINLAEFLKAHAVVLEDHPDPPQRQRDLIEELAAVTSTLSPGDPIANGQFVLAKSEANWPIETSSSATPIEYPLKASLVIQNRGYRPISCRVRTIAGSVGTDQLFHESDALDSVIYISPRSSQELDVVLYEHVEPGTIHQLAIPTMSRDDLRSCTFNDSLSDDMAGIIDLYNDSHDKSKADNPAMIPGSDFLSQVLGRDVAEMWIDRLGRIQAVAKMMPDEANICWVDENVVSLRETHLAYTCEFGYNEKSVLPALLRKGKIESAISQSEPDDVIKDTTLRALPTKPGTEAFQFPWASRGPYIRLTTLAQWPSLQFVSLCSDNDCSAFDTDSIPSIDLRR